MKTELPPADDLALASTAPDTRTGPIDSPATDFAVVRGSLRGVVLAVTAIVLVSIPALFALADLRALHERAVLQAAITADRIALVAMASGANWMENTGALREVLNSLPEVDVGINRALLRPNGRIAVAVESPTTQPALHASAPVLVHGRRVADVAVAISLRPLLAETVLVTLFAAVIAAGMYLVIDRVALRALRDALDHLQTAVGQRDEALHETSQALAQLGRQNARLRATSDELSRARDSALTADRSKSMFLAAMSHELRTPLNAIIGFSEVMARELYGPIGHTKYRDYSADIRASGDHLLALIDDVLDLSQVEAGKLVLRREPLDLVDEVDACFKMVQGRAKDSGIALAFDRPAAAGDAGVHADRVRLRQILLNLLTNAVKFTDHGGRIRIAVDTSSEQDLVVRIEDTGVGMSPEDLERVFRAFERVDVGLARPTEGAGLGLALTRALVQEHEGTIHIASRLGQGTTVTVTLPRLAGRTDDLYRGQMSLDDALRDRDTASGG